MAPIYNQPMAPGFAQPYAPPQRMGMMHPYQPGQALRPYPVQMNPGYGGYKPPHLGAQQGLGPPVGYGHPGGMGLAPGMMPQGPYPNQPNGGFGVMQMMPPTGPGQLMQPFQGGGSPYNPPVVHPINWYDPTSGTTGQGNPPPQQVPPVIHPINWYNPATGTTGQGNPSFQYPGAHPNQPNGGQGVFQMFPPQPNASIRPPIGWQALGQHMIGGPRPPDPSWPPTFSHGGPQYGVQQFPVQQPLQQMPMGQAQPLQAQPGPPAYSPPIGGGMAPTSSLGAGTGAALGTAGTPPGQDTMAQSALKASDATVSSLGSQNTGNAPSPLGMGGTPSAGAKTAPTSTSPLLGNPAGASNPNPTSDVNAAGAQKTSLPTATSPLQSTSLGSK